MTMSAQFSQLYVSIVIPTYNEKQSIEVLLGKLHEVFDRLVHCKDYEILFIDDGSTDGTRELLEKLAKSEKKVRAIFFRKNFQKSAALAAGFEQAKGNVILTMDADLQDEPQEIPKFLEKITEGYDLVSGWKKKRNDPLEKKIASKVFNWVVSRSSGVKLNDFNCGFKAYRSWCLKKIDLSGNFYRFLPLFVARQGGKIAEIAVEHHARPFGKSKYGFTRYFHGLIDLFTVILLSRFSSKPMYFFALIAAPLFLFAFAIGSYLLGGHILWLVTGEQTFQLNNRPLLHIAIVFFTTGLNVTLAGLLAELILHSSGFHKKTLFSIEREVSSETSSDNENLF